ncbi:uncharacterized protein LOC107465531 [Arachis duranensis]|uniref:Uncharacterized protein n=2 Tax=Arachis TaxID=3817 RepID=A0A445BJY2_ARAHY|nr:uncharacterized protein LOC107465531 [Arachis duranensis]XP_025621586.1 uncharacterized protein LOC112712976 [Arachis hypogaea]QHO34683.1 uncharacterized protein DS421_9g269010 [Arachis hypogaea]RYR38911.1 hypothetical protein Ahy_A09g044220 [Arachis hypogaea]
MIPACFGQPNTPSSSGISQQLQNVVTRIYQTQLCNNNNNTTCLTLSWSRTLFSHSLTIYAPQTFSITIPLRPPTFPFFRTRPGSKSIYLAGRKQKPSQKIKIYWDFSNARFFQNHAEPESCFYLAIWCNGRLELFLGDLIQNQQAPCDQVLLSRREHVFGTMSYVSRGVFLGSKHEIEIECINNGGVLRVKVDGEVCLVVKRLAWKFRGNEKIFIDGVEVEFYWDVLRWVVNNSNGGNGNKHGHGVFVFQVGDGAVWPEMVGPEKRLMRKSLPGSTTVGAPSVLPLLSPASSSGVLQWAEESSDGGRSSCSSSTRSCGGNGNGGGFSLLLYAWRIE